MLALEELRECGADQEGPEARLEQKELEGIVRKFVSGLRDIEQDVFVCRYWYLDSVADIAARFGFTENKVSMMLHRIRGKLQKRLKQEGYPWKTK